MLYWIINALLSSISWIFWKKSLDLSTLPPSLFFGIGVIGNIVVSIVIIALGKFEIPTEAWILALPFVDAFVVIYTASLSQRLYKEEKISTLLPYENLSSVIIIILAFFLFRDTPLPTLIIAILVIALMFVFSFDFSKYEFPKKFKLIVICHSINATRALMMGYALVHLTSPTFYAGRNILTMVVVWGMIVYAGQAMLIRGAKKEFLIPRLVASWLGAIASLIGFTLIAELGLITTTLLWFLSMLTTLVFGYIFLADRPEKKNIMLAITIALLVAFWVFFKT